jgi:hypothetical protein
MSGLHFLNMQRTKVLLLRPSYGSSNSQLLDLATAAKITPAIVKTPTQRTIIHNMPGPCCCANVSNLDRWTNAIVRCTGTAHANAINEAIPG